MSAVVNRAKDEKIAKDAYDRVKADWAALQPDQLLQVNLDLQLASQTILGSWPEIKALREQLVKELPNFNVTQFDLLEDYVLALTYVQARYAMATQPPNDLQELVDEATNLRGILQADAEALARRGLFQTEKLAGLKGGTGYRNLAQDLQALATELTELLPVIQGKAATTVEDLQAATQMSTRLTRIVGVREQSPAVLAALAEERLRAFTFVIKVYEEARAAISYLRRREDDVDQIAPNLYTGNAQRRKANEPQPAPSPPATGTPTGASPAVPAPAVPAPGSPSPSPSNGGAAAAHLSEEQPFAT